MTKLITRKRTARRASPGPTIPVDVPAPSREVVAARRKSAAEIDALIHLAALDAVLLAGPRGDQGVAIQRRAAERSTLAGRLSADVLDAYDRAMRGGRQPAVVSLDASVCSGCRVRLHSTLEQKVRRRRGVAACPHCLRLVYDPSWLASATLG